MTAETKTFGQLSTALQDGGKIIFVTGTATVWLILINYHGLRAWSVTP